MNDQDKVTAYHEAGHAVALVSICKKVRRVVVRDNGNGETYTEEELNALVNGLPEKALIRVCFSGMYAEKLVHPSLSTDDVAGFFDTYIMAGGDRAILYEAAKSTWLNQKHDRNWPQIMHNSVEKFVQQNQEIIKTLADALLKKPGYPKVLEGMELQQLLKDVKPVS